MNILLSQLAAKNLTAPLTRALLGAALVARTATGDNAFQTHRT